MTTKTVEVDARILRMKTFIDEYNRTGTNEAVVGFTNVGWPAGAFLPKDDFRQAAVAMVDATEKKEGKQSFSYNIALTVLAFSEYHSGRYTESLSHYGEAQKQFTVLHCPEEEAICGVVVGAIYRTMGDLELGLRYMMVAHEILQNTSKYQLFAGFCAYQMAESYSELQQYDEALKYHNNVLEIVVDPEHKNLFARSLNGLGCVYLQQKNYPLALKFLTESMEECERSGNMPLKARVFTDLGNYYYQLQNYTEAISFQQKGLAIREELGIKNGSITNLVHLAEIYMKQLQYENAIENLTRALAMAEELLVKQKVYQIHLLLSDIYALTGEVDKAFNHFRIYHAVNEEVHHDDATKKLRNLQLVFEAEQTRKENTIIKKQNEVIEAERKESERLLLNILPAEVADDLKRKGESAARYFNNVTVLFTDFVDFTHISEQLTPQQLVDELHACFKAFDGIISKYDIEKIKTVGDAYLAVSGLPNANPNHALDVVKAAVEIQHFMCKRRAALGKVTFETRVGIHSGSVVAGIVGVKKFSYDIWGDTVNTAARMEQNSEPCKINISETTYQLVKDNFTCQFRGEIEAKNKGKLKMYFIEAAH